MRARASQRAVHRVAYDDVLFGRGLAQCLDRLGRSDATKRDRGAGAYFGILTTSEEPFPIEHRIEVPNSRVSAKRSIPLEECHLLREIGLANALAFHDALETAKHGAIGARRHRAHRGNANVAVRIIDCALERLHGSG